MNILNAVSSVMLGGCAVLCGRYLGRGDTDRTGGVFSLNMTLTFAIGAVMTVISFLIPGVIADILGTTPALRGGLITYIRGFAIGIIPMLLSQQLASFLQMERQSRRGYAGIAGMIITNVVLDIILVAVFGMGMWGLAVSTSISNWVYFLILVPYYFTSKAQLRYDRGNIAWGDLPAIIKYGFPGALLVFCIAIRGTVINRILLTYAGNDGLSAMSAFNMVCGIFIAYAIGNGSAVRMLTSIFFGEADSSSMKQILKIVLTKGMLMACVITVIMVALSPTLASIFFPDRSTEVYRLTRQLFIIYAFSIPMVLLCQIATNYLQAIGHMVIVNIQSVFDGFFSMVIPAYLLAPSLGALGVWLANPIGMVLTLLTVPIYELWFWKRMPRTVDEWMLLPPDFGVPYEDVINIQVHNMEGVTEASSMIHDFCEAHDMDSKSAYFSALCLEEMASNVVTHGFVPGRKNSVTVRVVYANDTVILRLKDDCPPFDPAQMAKFIGEDSMENIGIRTVMRIADDVNYQNLLGLNVLTILIREEDLRTMEKIDFILEKRLRELDPDLHSRFTSMTLGVQNLLSRFRILFPTYTDHSDLHSMTVIDSCNRLIGNSNLSKLNKHEIYILLVGCYLHDIGMGVTAEDYEEWKDRFGADEYFAAHPDAEVADFVRDYHHELGALIIEKYADFLDIPTLEHVYAIMQVARGHRKADLLDTNEYPTAYEMPDGSTVCLPYLAALVRLADEIDVAASRNPMILNDIEIFKTERDMLESRKLEAISEIRVTRTSFILRTDEHDADLLDSLYEMLDKMQRTLDFCRSVVNERTQFNISQKKVILRHDDE